MAVPDFQSVMRPMLELAADGKEHSITEARETLANTFGLTEDERKALLPSGRQSMFKNRVAWAKVYLTRAGALESTKRGFFRIADRGRVLLREVPERITIRVTAAPARKQEKQSAKAETRESTGSSMKTDLA